MRAALATAELDDADLRQIYDELKSIKTDALDPAGRLAMAITRSQTETSMRYALATAELDEADHHGLLHELLISAHLSASQRISAHLSASQRISAHRGGITIAAASRSWRPQPHVPAVRDDQDTQGDCFK